MIILSVFYLRNMDPVCKPAAVDKGSTLYDVELIKSEWVNGEMNGTCNC